MKPQNKLQAEVLALQSKFKKITPKEVKIIEGIFDNTCGPFYNKIYCHECNSVIGKKEDQALLSTKLVGIHCPTCKKDMIYKEGNYHREDGYVGKYDVIGRFQVIRIFYGEKTTSAKDKPRYFVSEVMRHFIAPTGHLVSISRETLMGSFYSSHLFRYGTDWTVHNNTGTVGTIRFKLHPYIMLDGPIKPELIRMGYNRQYEGELNPHQIIQAMYVRPIECELLYKHHQTALLHKMYYFDVKIRTYWNTIKIACRHKYFIKDAIMYFDYLQLLVRFKKDIQNPHYICPENLVKAHDHYVKKARAVERKKKLEELKAEMQADNKIYRKEKKKYFGLKFNKKNLVIEPLKRVQDFLTMGDIMSNCLFTNAFHKKKDLLVMVAKVDDEPVEVVAINTERRYIYQCYGYKNKQTVYNKEIQDLVNKNMKQIKKAS